MKNFENYIKEHYGKLNEQSGYVELDVSKFGNRELNMLSELLSAYFNNKTTKIFNKIFDTIEKIGFNMNSDYVFIMDEDYNTGVMNNRKVDLHINTPYEGKEGFYDELMDEYDEMNPEDQKYMDSLK